jgi:hypothetical protein
LSFFVFRHGYQRDMLFWVKLKKLVCFCCMLGCRPYGGFF